MIAIQFIRPTRCRCTCQGSCLWACHVYGKIGMTRLDEIYFELIANASLPVSLGLTIYRSVSVVVEVVVMDKIRMVSSSPNNSIVMLTRLLLHTLILNNNRAMTIQHMVNTILLHMPLLMANRLVLQLLLMVNSQVHAFYLLFWKCSF